MARGLATKAKNKQDKADKAAGAVERAGLLIDVE
jgi:hypothetical protein